MLAARERLVQELLLVSTALRDLTLNHSIGICSDLERSFSAPL